MIEPTRRPLVFRVVNPDGTVLREWTVPVSHPALPAIAERLDVNPALIPVALSREEWANVLSCVGAHDGDMSSAIRAQLGDTPVEPVEAP